MPAKARLPSGTLVEVLCGQPEQKYGVRLKLALAVERCRSFCSISATRSLIASDV